MKELKKEAIWAVTQLKEWKEPEDTCLLFQSWNLLDDYLDHLKEVFSGYSALHAIAIKTNPHPAVLKYIVSKGFGLEAASIEEVEMAISAGIAPEKLVFDSPVKTKSEIKACQELYSGINLNVNSLEELKRIPDIPSFTLGLRINPMIDTGAPEIYHVSQDESKFGEPISNRKEIISACVQYPVTLLHIHSGSALEKIETAVDAIYNIVSLANEINQELSRLNLSRRIKSIDIGGGLKPEVLSQSTSKMQQYEGMLSMKVPELKNFTIITEFGQWCHFYCGYAYSTVEYVLKRGIKQLLFLHVGADFLMRDAYVKPRGIEFIPLNNANQPVEESTLLLSDLAGPLCFAGDYLQKELKLPEMMEGDAILLLGTGSNAYGLWSRHCSRSIPKIIGVDFHKKQLQILSNRKKINL